MQRLVALGGGPQHRIARAPADVGRERDPDAGVDQASLIEQARAEKEVRCRTEGGDRPARRHRGDFTVLEMDAMPEHRSWPEQPGAVVDVEVAFCARKERRHQLDLRLVLVEMGLDVSFREFARQGAGGLQLRLARRHGEAGRDRIVEPSPSLPALDQRLALVVAALRRIGERRGRVPVHHRLAGDHAGAAPLGRGEECVDRLRMDRAIDHGGGRAAADELVEKELGNPRAMTGIDEFLLFDKRIVVQPVEQLRAVGADDLGLRIMDVGVDEPGHDEAAGMVVDRRAVRGARENVPRFADRLDPPVPGKNGPVVEIMASGQPRCRGIVREGEDAAADDPRVPRSRQNIPEPAAPRCGRSRPAPSVSASGSLTSRFSKAARISALLLPLTAMMNGKPNRAR